MSKHHPGFNALAHKGEGHHSGAHPGFKSVAARIAKKQGIPIKEANAELAASTRRAGPAARAANPRLNRVKGVKAED
jgi:predicted glycoside hydrolase/deacetylase ChbG (UPF0249 family)